MRRYISIATDEQLKCCLMNEIELEVWVQDDLDLTSRILEFDTLVLKFPEGYYLRANIELRVQNNFLRGVPRIS
ncbi:hypothetical protein [Paenibacillus favisporus]|uniref:hypothetical protein n=1 Tax=Paenibacillus favisporus TaxID=221028 RepID=UPI003D2D67FC